jgi:cysteine synthase
LGTADVPRIYDASLLNQIAEVSTREAEAMASRLARHEGLFVGISAGAAVVAALRVGRGLDEGVVVALLPDGGFKYSSAPFWADCRPHAAGCTQSEGPLPLSASR